MNGSYKALVDYISPESIKIIDDYEKNHKAELEFRYKNFSDKYGDAFANYLITLIKNSDIMKLYTLDKWIFEYQFLGADIKIIDPENPDTAFELLNIFFKNILSMISVDFIEFELVDQKGDYLRFNITVKNPLKERYIKYLESTIK